MAERGASATRTGEHKDRETGIEGLGRGPFDSTAGWLPHDCRRVSWVRELERGFRHTCVIVCEFRDQGSKNKDQRKENRNRKAAHLEFLCLLCAERGINRQTSDRKSALCTSFSFSNLDSIVPLRIPAGGLTAADDETRLPSGPPRSLCRGGRETRGTRDNPGTPYNRNSCLTFAPFDILKESKDPGRSAWRNHASRKKTHDPLSAASTKWRS